MASRFQYRVKIPPTDWSGLLTLSIAMHEFPRSRSVFHDELWIRNDLVVSFKSFMKSCKSYKIHKTFTPWNCPTWGDIGPMVTGIEFRFTNQTDASLFRLTFL